MTVVDAGSSDNDTVIADGIGWYSDTTYSLTIEDRHLLVYDTVSGQFVYAIDWQSPENKIEQVVLNDGTYSYDDIAENIFSGANYLGNYSWEELSDQDTALMNSEIEFYKALYDNTGSTHPAFTISKLSQTGDTVVFGLTADASQDPDSDGLGSFGLTFNYDPSAMTLDTSAMTFAAGLIGTPGTHDTTAGTIEIGSFAFPYVTDLSSPLVQITTTLLDSSQPVVLNITSTAFDDVALDNSTATFNFNSHDLTGTVVSRGGGILSDVAITADMFNSSSDLTTISSDTGTFAMEVDNGASVSLLTDMIHTNASPTKAITPQDALEALRLSVGLTTIGGSKTVLDFMAADFNQNGKVTPQDALDILKYSVGLRELDTEWMFVDSAGDYSGITKGNVSFTEGVSIADMSADASVGLTGILLGDVNDTYTSYLDSSGTVV